MYAQDYDENLPYPDNTDSSLSEGIGGRGKNADVWCSDGATWKQRILPYTKNNQIFVCPDYKKAGGANDPADCLNSTAHQIARPSIPYTGNYGMNAFWTEGYDDPASNATYTPITRLSKAQSPAETFLAGENTEGDWTVEPESLDEANDPGGKEPSDFAANDPPERKSLPKLAAGCDTNLTLPHGYSPVFGSAASTADANPGHVWSIRHSGGGIWAFMDGHTKWMKRDAMYSQGPSARVGSCYYWRLTKPQ